VDLKSKMASLAYDRRTHFDFFSRTAAGIYSSNGRNQQHEIDSDKFK